ncbi:sigma factor [Actinocorallia longicatena]|uniref:sigma factor n=1 Tax=Actinocorallia longicatena TaxID=111803 RepID=UPI0031DA838C
MPAPPDVRTEDADVVRRSLSEPEAFTEIYHRHFEAIHGYLAGRLGPQHADDLAAEAFLAAFRRRTTFDPARGSRWSGTARPLPPCPSGGSAPPTSCWWPPNASRPARSARTGAPTSSRPSPTW